MAHESFEDPETARLMNALFINIKIDREERPDLDKIYQTAHHLLTRRNGGWPLTAALAPDDQTPYFAGTYFPREPRYGMPSFKEVLQRVAAVYRERRQDIKEQNTALREALSDLESEPSDAAASLDAAPLRIARRQLEDSFDAAFGGFGSAPKFPHPTSLDRLFRVYAASIQSGTIDQQALKMAVATLSHMARGGIYDQLGGGFCRYSVDGQWMIPHFEKMLYDNGPLLALYSEAWQITGDPQFEKVALETADWALRDMQSPEGGFYSSLDADSEGHEGKFYVWDRSAVKTLLDSTRYALFARCFGLDSTPNFEGAWHLHHDVSLEEAAAALDLQPDNARALLDDARAKLLAIRNQRIWPGRDEKILVSWNALMIKGLAVSARILERHDYAAAAECALDFIRDRMFADGRLLATYKDGRAHLNAYLDDYAFLLDAILQLLEARWRDQDLSFAITLADVLLAQYEDKPHGGFYFTSHDHETLIQRSKPLMDDALPAGAGVAAYALGRLGHLIGELRYLEAAERTLRSAWPGIMRYPSAANAMLMALDDALTPPEIVVIRGSAAESLAWQKRAARHYAPRRLCVAIPADSRDLPGLLAERRTLATTVAYVCEGSQCRAPVPSLAEFDALLSKNEFVK
jgi:hypothetical protein